MMLLYEPSPQIITIGNKPSVHQKSLSFPDVPDGPDKTSYPFMVIQRLPVTQAIDRIAYLPCAGYYPMSGIGETCCGVYCARRLAAWRPLLSVCNVETYTHD
jgi:hypothetical protein